MKTTQQVLAATIGLLFFVTSASAIPTDRHQVTLTSHATLTNIRAVCQRSDKAGIALDKITFPDTVKGVRPKEESGYLTCKSLQHVTIRATDPNHQPLKCTVLQVPPSQTPTKFKFEVDDRGVCTGTAS